MDPSPEQLAAGISHINYELWRLAQYADAYESEPTAPHRPALFESALVHLRCLMEFLGTAKDPALMHAWQYAGDRWRPKESQPLDMVRVRWGAISGHVVHLGWRRVTNVQETEGAYADWPLRDFAVALLDAFTEFVDTIQDDAVATRFRDGIADARATFGIR